MDQTKTLHHATRKLKYYYAWYMSLDKTDLHGWLGLWIFERVQIYSGIIKEIEEALGKYPGPNVGRYHG